MLRCCLVALLLLFPLAARAQTKQQALVDRATLATQDLLTGDNVNDRISMLARARAVMVCPRIFRLGLIIAGSGGECVLVARDGAGSWSAPAFYSIGTGSVGLQIGLQDGELMMMILTEKGLNAVMDSQFKVGGDASVAFATLGSGIEGATALALHADIVAYSKNRGLFAGVSLNGSLLTSDTDWNRAYYGQDLAARQIVMQMQVNNPGADPLRAMLQRFANADATAPAESPAATPSGSTHNTPQPLAPVQQQDLAAPAKP